MAWSGINLFYYLFTYVKEINISKFKFVFIQVYEIQTTFVIFLSLKIVCRKIRFIIFFSITFYCKYSRGFYLIVKYFIFCPKMIIVTTLFYRAHNCQTQFVKARFKLQYFNRTEIN